MSKINNICCIGAGYVGGPTMAVFAKFCKEIKFHVVDINKNRIDAWNDKSLKNLPIYEPGLDEIIKECRDKNLFFSSLVEESISKADLIFLSVNTPTKQKGFGAGKASDLRWVEESARQVAKFAKGHTIVVEKSTLPVRTAETIKNILDSSHNQSDLSIKSKSFSVLSNPEFLAEGTAIKDLISPDRVLIGGDDEKAIQQLSKLYENWVPRNKILKTNLWSSELSKLTANAFLAQRISSINSISAICEATGANVREVANAIGTDQRIGNKFLKSGPGFGGSCFQKDILNLVYLCEFYGIDEVSKYWQQVVDINNWQKKRISKLIVRNLFGTLKGKKIAIFGFAFKENTNDTRESPAISICTDLLEEGAFLSVYDPKVISEQINNDLIQKQISNSNENRNWETSNDLYSSVEAADAIVLMTEWEEFKKLDWQVIYKSMRKPAWIFDTRGFLELQKISQFGFKYWCIGR